MFFSKLFLNYVKYVNRIICRMNRTRSSDVYRKYNITYKMLGHEKDNKCNPIKITILY